MFPTMRVQASFRHERNASDFPRLAKAVAASGAIKNPIQDQFYGDRSGTIVDPIGHNWTIAPRGCCPNELQRRTKAMMS